MRVVPLEAFRDRISFAGAGRAVERGFRALALGEATLPDPMVVELAEQRAEVHVKGAHLRGARHIVLKVATGFYRNRARGVPSGDGMFLLLDAETGAPDLLLEEHGYLTDFRTAAAVGLTLRYFFFSSRRRHTMSTRDWSSDVCSSDLAPLGGRVRRGPEGRRRPRSPAAVPASGVGPASGPALEDDQRPRRRRTARRTARCGPGLEIGRASCRERGSSAGVAGSLARKE